MLTLTIGLLAWSLAHFIPAVPLAVRGRMVGRLGNVAYKGIMALVIAGSVALMVIGWKSAPPDLVFVPPEWGGTLALLASLAASILFFAPYMHNNLKRGIRHPQLAGVLLWGLGHCIATGQLRALVLFGGLSAWALAEILLLNRRDGAWSKGPPAPWVADLRLVLAGLGFFAILMFTHQGLFGVSPVPHT